MLEISCTGSFHVCRLMGHAKMFPKAMCFFYIIKLFSEFPESQTVWTQTVYVGYQQAIKGLEILDEYLKNLKE